ncbi:MAG: ABC transporter permease [Actinobacteria bacterium]|nr:ABC transporter permease [Actinomycetota bacterium]
MKNEAAALEGYKSRTLIQIFSRRFFRHKLAVASLIVLFLLYLLAILAPFVTPFEFDAIDLKNNNMPPSLEHIMGTDELGRDELTRIVYGGRVSLMVGTVVALMASMIGTMIGVLAGYYGRVLDNILMRFTDLILSLPLLPLLIVVAAVKGPGLVGIILILAILTWTYVARLVRASFLSIREEDYVQAARAVGASDVRIIFRHMLPNAVAPIIVNTTLMVGIAILIESVLSYLGFGIQPPTPSWGNMLYNAKTTMRLYPWLTYFPGLMIVITVLCFNFVGDGLRDALDPKQTIEKVSK